MAQMDSSAEGLGDASLEESAIGAMDGVECAVVSEENFDTFGRSQPTLLGESVKNAPLEESAVGALNQVGHTMAFEENLDTSGSSQPTLLGIPQELRDKIVRTPRAVEDHEWAISLTMSPCEQFEYVYDTGEKIRWIDLIRVSSPDEEDTAYIPGLHLPSKDPLLICRQIYAEMKKMQVARYRDYWQKNIFVVDAMNHRHRSEASSRPRQNTQERPAPSELVTNENLKHIHRIAFRMNAYWESYVLCFAFSGAWRGFMLLPRAEAPPRALIRYIFPQGSESANVQRTLTELNARVGDEAIRNPSRGRGFTTFRLFEFMNLLKHRFVEFWVVGMDLALLLTAHYHLF
jgi:hypothetical protein